MDIKQLLQQTIDLKASDLHLLAGVPPNLRIDGVLTPLTNFGVLTPEIILNLVKEVLSSEQFSKISIDKELDFSFPFSDKARFRVNAYTQKGSFAVAFRRIPFEA